MHKTHVEEDIHHQATPYMSPYDTQITDHGRHYWKYKKHTKHFVRYPSHVGYEEMTYLKPLRQLKQGQKPTTLPIRVMTEGHFEHYT
jgi:hypothetical protein